MARSSTTVPKKVVAVKTPIIAKLLDNNTSSLEVTYPYTVYARKGITYLPHYRENIYVAPGFAPAASRTYTESELKDLGAIPKTEMLWLRSRKTA
jgi:hypothetical protein